MPQVAQGRERHIADVAYLENLHLVVGPGVEPVLPPAAHSVVTAQAALDHDDARRDLHVIVHQCQNGIEIAPVEGLNGSVESSTFSCDIARAVSRRGEGVGMRLRAVGRPQ
jgi:hypothetical protein